MPVEFISATHTTPSAEETGVAVGDHDIVLLRVHQIDADPAVAPLVFHGSRFRRLEP